MISDSSQYKYNFLDLYLKEILINNNKEIKDEEIIDNFLSLFIAGTDTTANLAGSSLYYLSLYPEVQDKAREEVMKVLSSKTDKKNPNELFNELDYKDLSIMNYITSILKETLRLLPPAPHVFSRTCQKDITIGKFPLKKGTQLNTYFIAT